MKTHISRKTYKLSILGVVLALIALIIAFAIPIPRKMIDPAGIVYKSFLYSSKFIEKYIGILECEIDTNLIGDYNMAFNSAVATKEWPIYSTFSCVIAKGKSDNVIPPYIVAKAPKMAFNIKGYSTVEIEMWKGPPGTEDSDSSNSYKFHTTQTDMDQSNDGVKILVWNSSEEVDYIKFIIRDIGGKQYTDQFYFLVSTLGGPDYPHYLLCPRVAISDPLIDIKGNIYYNFIIGCCIVEKDKWIYNLTLYRFYPKGIVKKEIIKNIESFNLTPKGACKGKLNNSPYLDVDMSPDGDFVAVFVSREKDTPEENSDIFVSSYDKDGKPCGLISPNNFIESGSLANLLYPKVIQANPTVAITQGKKIIVAWENWVYFQEKAIWPISRVLGRVFTFKGSPTTNIFVINDDTKSTKTVSSGSVKYKYYVTSISPEISVDSDSGDMAIVYNKAIVEVNGKGLPYGDICIKKIHKGDYKCSKPITVNNYKPIVRTDPSISFHKDICYVTWTSYVNKEGIISKIYGKAIDLSD